MTAMPARHGVRLVGLTAAELRPLLAEALEIYVTAMRYPPGAARQRSPMWLEHMLRTGWRCTAAFGGDTLVGIAYGYRGAPGQWWHDEVRRGLEAADQDVAQRWLTDYFELTELHVHPDSQGQSIGYALLRQLLSTVDAPKVLLSTPEGPTRAWRLYNRAGFVDLLRDYRFTGDPRPFAVLGRHLPL
ncbi:MAG: GNAT family N-acetyltransferase [Pseudonocardiaceae bacterium]|nr:GNAT family N-acetyltransferase [Pseudonocardiaceae bacterium]